MNGLLVFLLSDNFSRPYTFANIRVIEMMQYFEKFYHVATVASVTQSWQI